MQLSDMPPPPMSIPACSQRTRPNGPLCHLHPRPRPIPKRLPISAPQSMTGSQSMMLRPRTLTATPISATLPQGVLGEYGVTGRSTRSGIDRYRPFAGTARAHPLHRSRRPVRERSSLARQPRRSIVSHYSLDQCCVKWLFQRAATLGLLPLTDVKLGLIWDYLFITDLCCSRLVTQPGDST
jgi:hypothetical protein